MHNYINMYMAHTCCTSQYLSCISVTRSYYRKASATVLYCTVLYCTVLYCTVLYCTVLYCTVLYCTVLYCTVLYCTVLYCTVLYCTVLYCTVLYRYPVDINRKQVVPFYESFGLIGMLLPEKYKDEGPSLETSKFSLYFSGSCIPISI